MRLSDRVSALCRTAATTAHNQEQSKEHTILNNRLPGTSTPRHKGRKESATRTRTEQNRCGFLRIAKLFLPAQNGRLRPLIFCTAEYIALSFLSSVMGSVAFS